MSILNLKMFQDDFKKSIMMLYYGMEGVFVNLVMCLWRLFIFPFPHESNRLKLISMM